jgi:hypothetical protein
MSAFWHLQATGNEGEVHLYWFSNLNQPYRIRFDSGNGEETHDFAYHREADEFARTHGVSIWRVVEMVRAVPIAEAIPIQFPDSPNETELREWLADISRGKSLNTVASEHRLPPMLLRGYLLGCDPTFQGLG